MHLIVACIVQSKKRLDLRNCWLIPMEVMDLMLMEAAPPAVRPCAPCSLTGSYHFTKLGKAFFREKYTDWLGGRLEELDNSNDGDPIWSSASKPSGEAGQQGQLPALQRLRNPAQRLKIRNDKLCVARQLAELLQLSLSEVLFDFNWAAEHHRSGDLGVLHLIRGRQSYKERIVTLDGAWPAARRGRCAATSETPSTCKAALFSADASSMATVWEHLGSTCAVASRDHSGRLVRLQQALLQKDIAVVMCQKLTLRAMWDAQQAEEQEQVMAALNPELTHMVASFLAPPEMPQEPEPTDEEHSEPDEDSDDEKWLDLKNLHLEFWGRWAEAVGRLSAVSRGFRTATVPFELDLERSVQDSLLSQANEYMRQRERYRIVVSRNFRRKMDVIRRWGGASVFREVLSSVRFYIALGDTGHGS
ncbi:unnamed protein product [Symbiodinium sp. KB8]|nr:unnamed protein product [Symbiodinium sp. KB8]